MKSVTFLLAIVLSCLTLVSGVEGQSLKLEAPDKWRSESVKLPPPFAPKVELKGEAQVYFSPGWGKKDSDQFFTYTFLFQTEPEPKFDKKVIEKELLAYFGGLASAVSRGKVDPAKFKLSVTEAKQGEDKEVSGDKQDSKKNKRFNAALKWTEPFFTKSEQTLNMEIVTRFDEEEKKNYLMVCASPQDPKSKAEASSKVWQQLRKIQAGFSKSRKTTEMPEKKPK